MRARGYGKLLGTLLLATGVAAACGGVDDGRINIVPDSSGGSGNSGGSSNQTGGNGGDDGSWLGGDGQGGDGAVPVLPEPPIVVAVTPEDGDGEAEPDGTIEIEFSEGLDPDTVTSDSIQILDGDTPIAGALDYSGVTVEFTPDERLDLLGEYSVVVTTDITDAGGTAMEEDFDSSFVVRDGVWSEEVLVAGGETSSIPLVSPVIDARGNALIVWVAPKPDVTENSVFGRTFAPGEGWSEPFEIDQSDAMCAEVSVAMNAAGEAVVAWTQDAAEGEEVWARRFVGGELEEMAERVDTEDGRDHDGTVSAMSPTGEAHVFWWFNDAGVTKRNLVTNHAEGSGAWGAAPEALYNYTDAMSPPAVAFDPDGNGFVFFVIDYTDTEPELYARRYLATGQEWGSGSPIAGSVGARIDYAPSVATDAEGGAVAVFTLGDDVMAVEFSKAGGYGDAAPVDALDSSPSSVPQVSSNGSKFLATWYQSASLTTNAYSALKEGGDAFGEPELRSSGDYQVGYYGRAVSGIDRRGNALVLFEQGNAVDTVDVVFGRLVDATGDWAEGALVNSLEGEYQDPRIAVAANGVAVAAWGVGIRNNNSALYVSTFE